MNRARRILTVGVALAALCLAGLPALSQTATMNTTAGGEANVMLTVRLGTIEGNKRVPTKSYDLVVAAGTSGSKLLSGSRVPFPAAGGAEEDEGSPRIVYQNIGFVTEVRAWVVDNNRVKIMADIEDSRLVDSEGGGPPTVETRQMKVNAILQDGVPLELTRVEGVADMSGFVEVEARILR